MRGDNFKLVTGPDAAASLAAHWAVADLGEVRPAIGRDLPVNDFICLGSRWTADDDETLERLWKDGAKDAGIAHVLHRTASAVFHRRHDYLGLTR